MCGFKEMTLRNGVKSQQIDSEAIHRYHPQCPFSLMLYLSAQPRAAVGWDL